ncbi:MAG: RT0821/Lpp0805 family surface protein, partial [Kiloniellales bacterium]
PPGLGGPPAAGTPPGLGGPPAAGQPAAAGSTAPAAAPPPGPQFAALDETGLLSLFAATEVGQKIQRSDHLYAERAGQESLEYYRSGIRSAWQNPDTGSAGTITPMRTFQRADGTYCRDFEQLVIAGGVTGRVSGTACRQPDTTWRLIRLPPRAS